MRLFGPFLRREGAAGNLDQHLVKCRDVINQRVGATELGHARGWNLAEQFARLTSVQLHHVVHGTALQAERVQFLSEGAGLKLVRVSPPPGRIPFRFIGSWAPEALRKASSISSFLTPESVTASDSAMRSKASAELGRHAAGAVHELLHFFRDGRSFRGLRGLLGFESEGGTEKK